MSLPFTSFLRLSATTPSLILPPLAANQTENRSPLPILHSLHIPPATNTTTPATISTTVSDYERDKSIPPKQSKLLNISEEMQEVLKYTNVNENHFNATQQIIYSRGTLQGLLSSIRH